MLFFIVSFIILVIGFIIYLSGKKALESSFITAGSVISGVGAFLLILNFFVVIPAGNVGVVDFLGSVSDRPLTAGVNVVNPLASVHMMSIKTKEIKETMDVPSKEGLTIHLEISVLYKLDPNKAPELYKTVGENFADILLIPQFRSVVRGVTASSEARVLYSSDRGTLEKTIVVDLEKLVTHRGIFIESAPLRGIILPASLSASIEEKQKADQENQRMEFVLQREKKEAERKRIEAQGIQDFQTIVAKGISQQLLEWKGIEATETLAKSPNAKIVIIGSGKNGLPIILNNN
jgi:regulator of protease activity HflC (stomatin/prohibitin superfamily)